MKETVKLLKALADETRLRIMRVLAKCETHLCVCEIVDALGLPQYLVSHHLSILRHAGAVEDSRQGTWVMYAVHPLASPVLAALLPSLKDSLSGEVIAEDDRRLASRIARRVEGKCVVGMKCCGK
jgi:ArsR family transcriptional regulator